MINRLWARGVRDEICREKGGASQFRARGERFPRYLCQAGLCVRSLHGHPRALREEEVEDDHPRPPAQR